MLPKQIRKIVAHHRPRHIFNQYVQDSEAMQFEFTLGLIAAHGRGNVYVVCDYEYPFDGYVGQDVLVFPNFNSQIAYSYMLNLLKPYPLILPARKYDREAFYTKVYVLSEKSILEQYNNLSVASINEFIELFDTIL